MAGYRFNIDLFIPEAVYNTIPLAKRQAIRDRIRELKSWAVKVNEGQPNEEITIKATWHKCYHDEGLGHPPCEPSQEI